MSYCKNCIYWVEFNRPSRLSGKFDKSGRCNKIGTDDKNNQLVRIDGWANGLVTLADFGCKLFKHKRLKVLE